MFFWKKRRICAYEHRRWATTNNMTLMHLLMVLWLGILQNWVDIQLRIAGTPSPHHHSNNILQVVSLFPAINFLGSWVDNHICNPNSRYKHPLQGTHPNSRHIFTMKPKLCMHIAYITQYRFQNTPIMLGHILHLLGFCNLIPVGKYMESSWLLI